MQQEGNQILNKPQDLKQKTKKRQSDKVAGKKRPASKKESNNSGTSHDDDSMHEGRLSEDDYNLDSFDLSGDESSTNNQLFKIERKIQQPDLTKRERRLLQNRKSALKCRLKKQQELDKMKKEVDKMSFENRDLKEKLSAMNALLLCKTEENSNLNKKYNELQFQQTLIIASCLSQNGSAPMLPRSQIGQNNGNSGASSVTTQASQSSPNPFLNFPMFSQLGQGFSSGTSPQNTISQQSLASNPLLSFMADLQNQMNHQQHQPTQSLVNGLQQQQVLHDLTAFKQAGLPSNTSTHSTSAPLKLQQSSYTANGSK